jgi:hypothetical protein
MKLTASEFQYLSAMHEEFGSVFGTNAAYSKTPPEYAPLVVAIPREQLPFAKRLKALRPYSRLTQAERQQIISERLRGVPHKKIEEIFHVTSATICRIQKDAGVTITAGYAIPSIHQSPWCNRL